MDNVLTAEQQALAMLRVLLEGRGWTVADERITDTEIYLIVKQDRKPEPVNDGAAGLPE